MGQSSSLAKRGPAGSARRTPNGRRGRWLGRTIVLAAALAVGGVLVSAGSADPDDDFYTYTANLCSLPVPGDCPVAATAPVLPGAGGSVDVYLTLQASGVTGVGEPDADEFVAFDSLTVGLPTGPAGLKYTAAAVTSGTVFSVTDSLVTLTGLAVPPGGLVTVKLTLDVPPCVSGSYNWSGAGLVAPGGSDGSLSRAVGNNSLTATPAGCHLSMETQPKDTVKNQHISDALYSSGGPVKVGLRDNSGGALVNLTGSCPSSGLGCVKATVTGGDSVRDAQW